MKRIKLLTKILSVVVCFIFMYNSVAFSCNCPTDLYNFDVRELENFAKNYKVINRLNPDYDSIINDSEVLNVINEGEIDSASGIILIYEGKRYFLFPSIDTPDKVYSYDESSQELKVQNVPLSSNILKAATITPLDDTCTYLIVCMLVTFFVAFGTFFFPCLIVYLLNCL